LGDNKSQVVGVGPQIGYLFPVGGMQGYLRFIERASHYCGHPQDGIEV